MFNKVAAVLGFLANLGNSTPMAAGFHSSTHNGKSYRGAAIDALTRNWIPQHRSGDAQLADSWNLLSARIGDLIRNEPSLGKAERDLNKHIVGCGITTFADVIDGERNWIDDFNDESDDWWDRYAEYSFEADVEGRRSIAELQADGHAQVIEQGEAIYLKCLDTKPGRTVPVCWQLLEATQLDESKNEVAGVAGNPNRIVRGVELDRFNRAVAYWIFDAHPYDQWSGWASESTRIPAERVLHYYLPMPNSATRGVSWFRALVRATRDADWLVGGELTAGALQALLVMIHKHAKMPTAGGGMGLIDGGSDTDALGNPVVKWGPGVKADIPIDDEIEVVESKRPGRQVAPFMKFMRQEQAMGAGLSYTTLTGDFSATSFTSAHGAANEENAYFRPLQRRFARHVVLPMRNEHTKFAAAYGLYQTLSATQFLKQPHRWSRLLYMPPGRDQLNPLDQSGASIDRMRSGLSTLDVECGLEGRHWRKTLRMKARIEAETARLKTSLDWSRGGGAPSATDREAAQVAVAEADDDAEEESDG